MVRELFVIVISDAVEEVRTEFTKILLTVENELFTEVEDDSIDENVYSLIVCLVSILKNYIYF